MKKIIKNIFAGLGYDLKKRENNIYSFNTKKAEEYPLWLEKADEAGMDVNDYLDSIAGSLHFTFEKILLPYLKELNNPIVMEIGTGTGRWSREIANYLKKFDSWKLFLIDHSPWIINFLQQYFKKEPNIIPVLNNGKNLPDLNNEPVDIIFSTGTFVEISLQQLYSFCKDFEKKIKKSGYVIFNFLDPDSAVGWEHMKEQSNNIKSLFGYHNSSTVDKVFSDCGFEPVLKEIIGKSTYAVYRKI